MKSAIDRGTFNDILAMSLAATTLPSSARGGHRGFRETVGTAAWIRVDRGLADLSQRVSASRPLSPRWLLKPGEGGGAPQMPPGQGVYQQHCQACHGANREGVAESGPALVQLVADPVNNIVAGAPRFTGEAVRSVVSTGKGAYARAAAPDGNGGRQRSQLRHHPGERPRAGRREALSRRRPRLHAVHHQRVPTRSATASSHRSR